MADVGLLRLRLEELDRVVIAFSGGADSAFLAWMANDTLGPERSLAVTAVSPSLAERERVHASTVAGDWGLRWREVDAAEFENEAYRRNDRDRCFWCKDALMDALGPIAEAEDAVVALGVNVDDLGDHRPGQEAAASRGAVFPLVEAGFTKDDVRRASRERDLSTWDRPAAPCLASRLPYGTAVTLGRLSEVERAEDALHDLGFVDLRVRHYGELARIEVARGELDRLVQQRVEVVAAVRMVGYRYVTLDLEGLRSGNLNR